MKSCQWDQKSCWCCCNTTKSLQVTLQWMNQCLRYSYVLPHFPQFFLPLPVRFTAAHVSDQLFVAEGRATTTKHGSTTTMYGCLSFAEPFFKIAKPVFHRTIGHTYIHRIILGPKLYLPPSPLPPYFLSLLVLGFSWPLTCHSVCPQVIALRK